MDNIPGFLLLIALGLAPGILAYNRQHKNAAAIMCMTVVLGWTVIGWLIALIWAMTDNRRN